MTPLERYLIQRIKEERETMMLSLARGDAKNYEDYRYAVGIIRGFDNLTGFLMDFKQATKEDDDVD